MVDAIEACSRRACARVNYRRHVIFFARIDAAGGAPVILRIVHQHRNMPALVYYEDVGNRDREPQTTWGVDLRT